MTSATLDEAVADATAEASIKKPVKVFKYRALSASVFANTAKNGGPFYSVSLQRTYKVGDEFKHSSSFTRDELPVARHLLQQAWEFILDAESREKSANAN